MKTKLFQSSSLTAVIAWLLTLLVSFFPDAILYELNLQVPWLAWAKVGLLAAFLLLCLAWKAARPLWKYALVLAVFYLSFELVDWLLGMSRARLSGPSGQVMLELFHLLAAAIMLAALWLLFRRPEAFFFARGDARVETEPVRWLGVRPGTSVRAFGLVFLLIAATALLIILLSGYLPDLSALARAARYLPFVLLAAALNSLGEEISFRVSLLSATREAVGRGQALWMAALFFGSAHYIGGQPGLLPGVLLTAFLGWGFGKCMVESKSILLPWGMHFVLNSFIFFFNAMGWALG